MTNVIQMRYEVNNHLSAYFIHVLPAVALREKDLEKESHMTATQRKHL